MNHYKTDKISVGTEMDGNLEYNVLKSYDKDTKKVSKFVNSKVELDFTPSLNIVSTPIYGFSVIGSISVPCSIKMSFTSDASTNVATRGRVEGLSTLNTKLELKLCMVEINFIFLILYR